MPPQLPHPDRTPINFASTLPLAKYRLKTNFLIVSGLVLSISLSACGPSPGTTYSPIPTTSPEGLSVAEQSEDDINKRIDQMLKTGELYHNIPETMEVGVQSTFVVGLAPKITEEIISEVKGHISTKSVRYNPKGTEIQISVPEQDFKVQPVVTGASIVTAKSPAKWIWFVTPLSSGNKTIIIRVIVTLEDPKNPSNKEVINRVIFEEKRNIKVNVVYSITEFTKTNWKEILTLIVGSGSLASLVTWWLGEQSKKKKNKSDANQGDAKPEKEINSKPTEEK